MIFTYHLFLLLIRRVLPDDILFLDDFSGFGSGSGFGESSGFCSLACEAGFILSDNCQCLLCPTGFYCFEDIAFQCSPGFKCPKGSVTQIACEIGTYQVRLVAVKKVYS